MRGRFDGYEELVRRRSQPAPSRGPVHVRAAGGQRPTRLSGDRLLHRPTRPPQPTACRARRTYDHAALASADTRGGPHAWPDARAHVRTPGDRVHPGRGHRPGSILAWVTIGYLEAWGLWFSGEQPPSDAVMGFMTVRWWGRVGKIAAFIGGATVILDLIGPDRLREISARSTKWSRRAVSSPLQKFAPLFVLLTLTASTFTASVLTFPGIQDVARVAALLAVLLTLLIVSAMMTRVLILQLLADAFANERSERVVRWAAIAVLTVGFHFDLLAS